MKAKATKKSTAVTSTASYMELQKRCNNLHQIRAERWKPVSATPGVPSPVVGEGSDSKSFMQNAIEDYALAPVLGLDRREVAASSFMYGSEDHFFYKALTTLHSLQRLRRRRVLAAAQMAGVGATAANEDEAAPSTPRSSAFTWDLVEPNQDDDFFLDDESRQLPEIVEEQGEGAEVTGPSSDSFESLTNEFTESVEQLQALGTADAKRRAKRLAARFALVAYDIAAYDKEAPEKRAEFLARLARICKVKHDHKPPAVPGMGVAEVETDAQQQVDLDYSLENQLRKHVQKCIREGRKRTTEWDPSDERCAAFWRPLTALGRAKLFSQLTQQLSQKESQLTSAEDPQDAPARVRSVPRHAAPPPQSRLQQQFPRQRGVQESRRRLPSDSGSGDESDADNDFFTEEQRALEVASDTGSLIDSEPREPIDRRPTASSLLASSDELTAKELVCVLARGVEYVQCPERREDILKVLGAVLEYCRDKPTKVREALAGEGARLWFPRLTQEERDKLAEEAPTVWSIPAYVAFELRHVAPPPLLDSSIEELKTWAQNVSRIIKRIVLPSSNSENNKLMMSEMMVYALYHALLVWEHIAWLEHLANGRASTSSAALGKVNVAVIHTLVSPMVVPHEVLEQYVKIWRPLGSGGFVLDNPSGSTPTHTRQASVCNSVASMVWNHSDIPAPRRRKAVSPTDDINLAERLIRAIIAAEGSTKISTLKLNEKWAPRVIVEASLTSAKASDGPNQAALLAYTQAKGNLVDLTERIEVDFEPCNIESFKADEPVEVLVRVKNCAALAVRVFRVDAWRYYTAHHREVPSDLSLEGLEPNAEVILSEFQQAPPIRQNYLRLRLPSTEYGGVFVLELIGNGVSCRALLHVGSLNVVEVGRDTQSQQLAVYDRSWQQLKEVSFRLDGGEEYETQDGVIVVPLTNDKSNGQWTKGVARSGSSCSLFEFMRYDSASYALLGGFFVEHEQLIEGNPSVVAVCRAQLFINQERCSFSFIKSAVFKASWRYDNERFQLGDRRDVALSDAEDLVLNFEVPRGAKVLKLELSARLANGAEIQLVPSTFTVHGVAEQPTTDDVHLCAGFALQTLGRSGEVVPGRLVEVQLQTALSSEKLGPFKCRTDANGKIDLGKLEGVVSVKATLTSRSSSGAITVVREWAMTTSYHSWAAEGAKQAAMVTCVPSSGALVPVPDFTAFVLDEIRFGDQPVIVQDLSHLVVPVGKNALQVSALPKGRLCRLLLWCPDGTMTERLLLTAEKMTSDGRFAVVDNTTFFEWRSEDLPPVLKKAELQNGVVRLNIDGVKPGARVHLVTRRFWQPLGLTTTSAKVPLRLPSRLFPLKSSESSFLKTRRVGDIIRYVLERRPLAAHPDFTPPSLPTHRTAPFPGTCIHGGRLGETCWAVHGDKVGDSVEQRHLRTVERPGPTLYYLPGCPKSYATANIAFVEASEVIANVQVGTEGIVDVKLPPEANGNYFFCEVVVVQPNAHVSALLVAEGPSVLSQTPHNRDMRLTKEVLDPARHYGEVCGSRVLRPGEAFELSTSGVSKMQVYDRLPQIFDALLALLNNSPELQRFKYLTQWPTLEDADKLAHYSRDACNEIHLFLYAHDRPFFDKIVAPLLANRRRYSRLDRWLLQLPAETEPPVAVLLASRLEQLLCAADSKNPSQRESKLKSIARLAEVDAAREAANTSLQRRTSAYNVLLEPHGMKLEPERSAPRAATTSMNAWGGGHREREDRGRGNRRMASVPQPHSWGEAEDEECASVRAVRCLARRFSPPKCRNYSEKERLQPQRQASLDYLFRNNEHDDDCQRSCSSGVPSDDGEPIFNVQQHGQASAQGNAWFCRPANKIGERAWLTASGPVQGGAALWREVCQALLEQPNNTRWPAGFVSAALLEVGLHGSVSEAFILLALLDLPFAPTSTPVVAVVDDAAGRQVKRVTVEGRPSIVFYRMLQEVEAPTDTTTLLLTQELRTMAGNVLARSSELLVNTVIKSELLVVNCGSQPRELRLLLQCPEGAIPLGATSFYTRTVDVSVPPTGSVKVENHFYFPSPGLFRWFPAHALAEEKLVAFEALGAPLRVVTERGAIDAASWRDVAARGSLDNVLSFLRRPLSEGGPPSDAELASIAWRMKDPEAFKQIIPELRSQLRFSKAIWGYGFLHEDVSAVKELLVMNDDFKTLVGPRVESEIITTEAHDGSVYSHCDFHGLVLSRAHTVGARRQNIEDSDVRKAYSKFLLELTYAPALSLEDRVLLTNFMLLQDRVDEAHVAFEPVKEVIAACLASNPTAVPGPLQLQAAYHMAYLDLIGGGELAHAKLAIRAYADVPWLTTAWRDRFAALKATVAAYCPGWMLESQGGPASSAGALSGARPAEAMGEEAVLSIEEFDPREHRVRIGRKGLKSDSCTLACYVVDVELTFSASPFSGDGSGGKDGDKLSNVTAIAPTVKVSVPDDMFTPSGWCPLPAAVWRRQMVLEVSATTGGKRSRTLSACRPCYFCDAEAMFEEQTGILRVVEADKPAIGAYVKVFAGGKGKPSRFYKDGYTDCLGAFDYVSLNAKQSPLSADSRLAVLVVTKQSGAMVREVAVPPLVRPESAAAEAAVLPKPLPESALVVRPARRSNDLHGVSSSSSGPDYSSNQEE